MTQPFKVLLLIATVLTISSSYAQQMKSPPATAEGTIGSSEITINYHQPAARSRDIMGGLVPFDKVWRTGANKATDFTTTKAIMVEGKELAAGTYGLFTIPGEEKWVIIFNSDHEQWGAYNYDDSKDVLRVEVTPASTEDFVESFTISVEEEGIVLEWEETRVPVNIKG